MLDFFRRERGHHFGGRAVLFALRGGEGCLLDYWRRGHWVLLAQFLLREVAKVIREQNAGFLTMA